MKIFKYSICVNVHEIWNIFLFYWCCMTGQHIYYTLINKIILCMFGYSVFNIFRAFESLNTFENLVRLVAVYFKRNLFNSQT